MSDVDDINALPPDFDVARDLQCEEGACLVRLHHDPVRSRFLGEGYGYDAMVRHFERDAVGLITHHPDVTFDIYLPPYSILQFVAMRDASPATLKIVTISPPCIAERLTQLPNVRLYDFRAIRAVTHDLDNYSDVIHHSPAVERRC